MSSEAARRPVGWTVRIGILWGTIALISLTAALLFYLYGQRIVQINTAYLDNALSQDEVDALNEQWYIANTLAMFATPLVLAVALLTILTLVIQARGWQLTRERARAARRRAPAR
jgi:hypothetical protein